MSRIGRKPITVPSGVNVTQKDGRINVKGPKGQLDRELPPLVAVKVDKDQITVTREGDDGPARARHGLVRALVNNMVEGVTKGYEKRLSIIGVGYRAALKGKDLEVQVGYSHPVLVPQPAGIEFEVPTATSVVIRGNDKQLVGEVAANIRKIRKPEPYKGKGVRYAGERVQRKAGKTGK